MGGNRRLRKKVTSINLLENIRKCAEQYPDRIAVHTDHIELTYGELDRDSDCLAKALQRICGDNHQPIAVYGHKNPYMLICFLACVKSGRAYCPIDTSVPVKRTEMILNMLSSPVVLTTEELKAQTKEKKIISLEQIQAMAKEKGDCVLKDPKKEDVFYIIFTSGSTGLPKGVQITAGALDAFLNWSQTLGNTPEEKEGKVFLNQAPFSFDLSVMDVYTCLNQNGTLHCLTKETQKDYRKLMKELKCSGASIWVSTPSFAEICLSDPAFQQEWMPQLSLFLFCGETLQNRTAARLQSRFPKAQVINTYGPTESTVAVTEVTVTPQMAKAAKALPVGRPKPGTWIEIQDEAGRNLPEGEAGEIVILGDTVSIGYYQEEKKSREAFFSRMTGEKEVRGYRTGDKGYQKDGMLYYLGRMDLQVKLHGYRIELEDIERNLMKLSGVERAAVVPRERRGKITSLNACVSGREKLDTEQMRRDLKEFLPDYMIPKKITQVEAIPVTSNGKTDRKALKEWEV